MKRIKILNIFYIIIFFILISCTGYIYKNILNNISDSNIQSINVNKNYKELEYNSKYINANNFKYNGNIVIQDKEEYNQIKKSLKLNFSDEYFNTHTLVLIYPISLNSEHKKIDSIKEFDDKVIIRLTTEVKEIRELDFNKYVFMIDIEDIDKNKKIEVLEF